MDEDDLEYFPQIRRIKIDDYINEINKSLETKNYLSALTVALMIPDICAKKIGDRKGYAKWYNKYVYPVYYTIEYEEENVRIDRKYKTSQVKLNGNVCYALRNAILHSGKSELIFTSDVQREQAKVDRIELCINGNSPAGRQYGEAVYITTCNKKVQEIVIRINIITLVTCIVEGYKEFKKELDGTALFDIIDWDKKGGAIVFTPNT